MFLPIGTSDFDDQVVKLKLRISEFQRFKFIVVRVCLHGEKGDFLKAVIFRLTGLLTRGDH